jgi:hypothetical protein
METHAHITHDLGGYKNLRWLNLGTHDSKTNKFRNL